MTIAILLASPSPGELQLALNAIDQVRMYGGVVEHPRDSLLWKLMGAKPDGTADKHGGWILPIYQSWWGHRAEKKTCLYIVGCSSRELPTMPISLATPEYVVDNGTTNHPQKGEPGWRPQLPHAEREHTPPELTQWLVELATRCTVTPNAQAQPPPEREARREPRARQCSWRSAAAPR
jgi:hypothetical protein